MRKFYFFLLMFFSFNFFAVTSDFYYMNKPRAFMYVNSLEGLKIRDTASLKGNRIGGLVDGQIVNIVQIGDEVTIDGIKAPWIKIEIPVTQRKIPDKVEYGWVFGGYLTNQYKEPVQKSVNSLYILNDSSKFDLDLNRASNLPQVTRKDFNGNISNKVIVTDFDKKFYYESSEGALNWFTNIPPYQTFEVKDSQYNDYYETEYKGTKCFVNKNDVLKGAIPAFTIEKTIIYSNPDENSKKVTELKSGTLIAVQDISNKDFAKIPQGYVKKNSIWSNPTDVEILKSFMTDSGSSLLDRTMQFNETNLFRKEREYYVQDYWLIYTNEVQENKKINDNNYKIKEAYKSLVELEKYFGNNYSYGYLTDKFYTGSYSYTRNYEYMPYAINPVNGKIGYYYDLDKNCIISFETKYAPYEKMTYNIELMYLYQDSLKDELESDRKVYYLDYSNRIKFDTLIGSDASLLERNIREWNQNYWGNGFGNSLWGQVKDNPGDYTEESKYTVKNDCIVYSKPGTRGTKTGNIKKGSVVNVEKYIVYWIKGEGESYAALDWIYIKTPQITGWIKDSLEPNIEGVDGTKIHLCKNEINEKTYSEEITVEAKHGNYVNLYKDSDNNETIVCKIKDGTTFTSIKIKIYPYANFHENIDSRYDYYVCTEDGEYGWIRYRDLYKEMNWYYYMSLK